VSEVDLGPIWQHLDFQFDHPALAQDFVRQAIAHGIDREAIVKRLVQPFAPDAEPLQNLIYVSNQEQYEDHFGIWNFDPAAATQLLEDNGCTTGGDGIYECDGEKLSFGYVSTAGNELRELMFQIIQAQLKDVGIQVKNEFSDPAVSLGEQLPAGDFDIIQFAWVGSPDPFGGNSIWLCEGGLNYNNYCNEDVTDLINQTNRALDPAERASLYNQADELMAQDLTVLPLWQAPQPFYYYDHVHGVDNNSTQQGITWNVGDWWIEQ
jgi:peptide/nickel transport system substrate-binding protein